MSSVENVFPVSFGVAHDILAFWVGPNLQNPVIQAFLHRDLHAQLGFSILVFNLSNANRVVVFCSWSCRKFNFFFVNFACIHVTGIFVSIFLHWLLMMCFKASTGNR